MNLMPITLFFCNLGDHINLDLFVNLNGTCAETVGGHCCPL